MEALYFYILGAITLVSAVFVVFMRRPLYNVLFMILAMLGMAGLYLQLHAEFLAMVQIVVYAGAVMILFLFVVMLLHMDQMGPPNQLRAIRAWAGGVAALAVIGVVMLVVFSVGPLKAAGTAAEAQVSNTEALAGQLFSTYLLPFEIASVLLLAAIIGAVVLVRKDS
ncbi:NADH-quinone oxidoreductase subunit J [Thermodesulfobacteriota bacterium]